MQEPVLQYQDDAKIIDSISSTDTVKPQKQKSFDVYMLLIFVLLFIFDPI